MKQVLKHFFWLYKKISVRVELARKLKAGKKLNIGCGSNKLSGYVNLDLFPGVDVTYFNATNFPYLFKSATIEAIFCEHMIEHISLNEAKRMLVEFNRMLQDGCPIRIITPNLNFFCDLFGERTQANGTTYLNWFDSDEENHQISRNLAMNRIFYSHGHQHLYDPIYLKHLLEEAGFRYVEIKSIFDTSYEVFINTEGHSKVIGKEIALAEGFAVEGIK